MSNNNCA